MKAWHFLADDKKLGYEDGRIVQVGETYRYKGEEPIEICRRGMHGSVRLMDALEYAPGPIVCRVDITGGIVKGDDKIVGRERKVLAMSDATNVLHEFACRCAETALLHVDNPDQRSIDAIEAKRKWLRGEITDEELAAAWDAARTAAWDAARAADGAADGPAAWAASRAAPRDAPCGAARTAACAAAWAASRAASRAAAWDAAVGLAIRAAQSRMLTGMVSHLLMRG